MLSKSLLIIFVLAVLLSHGSTGLAQPLTSEKLGPEVRSPESFDSLARPLLQKGVITEEDLPEDRPENRSRLSPFGRYVPTPVSPSFPVFPGEALIQEPVDEDEVPEEVQLGRENPPEEEEKSSFPILKSKMPPAPTSRPTSLLAKITLHTSPRRAASLRLTDEGRKLLDSGEYQKALQRLEKTIAIDSENPYSYYFLALVHHHMANHQASVNFLDIAESRLSQEPHWLARVFALKGKNFQVQGALEEADASYARALTLDPNNRTAFEALTRIDIGSM